MASFNKVILIGNLTRDPEVRYIPSGTAVTDIGLAVNHSWFDKQSNSRKEEVTFVDITLWGRTAEIAGEYLSKGRSVLIEGRLKMDTWQDKETGQNRSKLKVIGEQMTMLGSRGDGGESGGGRAAGGGQQAPSQQAPSQQAPSQQAPSQQAPGGNPQGAADAFYDSPPQQESGGEVPF